MRRVGFAWGFFPLLLSAVAAGQSADRPMSFSMVRQPLAQALNTFARQSNLRIVFNTKDADGRISESIQGTYTPRDALQRLLEHTPLRYEFVDERTVEIRAALTADAASLER